MSWNHEQSAIKVTMEAAADLSAKQYFFVKVSAANKVNICSGATDNPLGVLLNKPASGEAASVLVAGIGNVVVAAATAADGSIQLGTDANGKAEAKTVTGTGRVVAQPLTAGGADGDIITAAINCLNPFETA